MRTLIVIPARLASQRLPRKLLLAETGKPLIRHVVDVARAPGDCWPCIAYPISEQDEIYKAIEYTQTYAWGTLREHPNGTSRAAELVERVIEEDFEHPDIVVILQADEPEIDPAHLQELVQALQQHPEWDCATLATLLMPHEYADENRVKVIIQTEGNGMAIDFSRTKIFKRSPFRHIGIYAYRTKALQRYAAAGPCPREQQESLEQLRALHIGLRMGVVLVDHAGHGIDTREDYDAFVKRWKERQG